jgi:hypothetical protein
MTGLLSTTHPVRYEFFTVALMTITTARSEVPNDSLNVGTESTSGGLADTTFTGSLLESVRSLPVRVQRTRGAGR